MDKGNRSKSQKFNQGGSEIMTVLEHRYIEDPMFSRLVDTLVNEVEKGTFSLADIVDATTVVSIICKKRGELNERK